MTEQETTSTAPVNVSRNGLLSALAQAATMVAGGINAVVIGTRYPVSTDTDSLFMAFAIYSIWTVVGASVRTALVPRLLDTEQRFRPLNAALAALWWTFPVIVFAQLAIGIPLLGLLSNGDTTIGAEALLIFCPAALLQLAIGVGAAMFALLDDFVVPAKAFALGGVINIGSFLVLEPLLGLIAMPLAALLSSVVTAVVIFTGLRSHGWRSRGELLAPARRAVQWLKLIVLGSTYAIGTQVLFLISMVFTAAVLPVGSATIYTYAYMTIGLVIALSASSGAIALAAPVAESWTGDARDLIGVEDDVTRSMAVLLVGVAGVIATVGGAIAGPLLPGFTASDISVLVEVSTALCLLAFGSAVTIVPMVAMFTARRYEGVAVITLVSLPLLAALSAAALLIDRSLIAIAAAASMAVIAIAWGLLWLGHGAGTPKRIAVQIWQLSLVAVPGGAAYFIADRLLAGGSDPSLLAQLFAAIVGTAVLALYVALVLPTYRDLLVRMLLAVLGKRAPVTARET